MGDTLQRVPTSRGRDGSSTSLAAVLFCSAACTFIPHASPSLQTGGDACEHSTAPFARLDAGTSSSYRGGKRVRGMGRSERGRGRDWSRGGNGDGDGIGGGNGDVNGHGDGDGAGTGTGVEVNEGAQDGIGDCGDGAGTAVGTGVETRRPTPDGNGDGNGDGSEDSSGDGNGDEDNGNGNEDRIGEGGIQKKKRKKPKNSSRRHVGNEGDLGGKRENCRNERVGLVAANPDSLESNKEAGRGAQGTWGSIKQELYK